MAAHSANVLGFPLAFDSEAFSADHAQSLEAGHFEPHRPVIIDALTQPGDTVVQLGSGLGETTLVSAAIGRNITVFEPSPSACQSMHTHIQLNPELQGNIQIIEGWPVPTAVVRPSPAVLSVSAINPHIGLPRRLVFGGSSETTEVQTASDVPDGPISLVVATADPAGLAAIGSILAGTSVKSILLRIQAKKPIAEAGLQQIIESFDRCLDWFASPISAHEVRHRKRFEDTFDLVLTQDSCFEADGSSWQRWSEAAATRAAGHAAYPSRHYALRTLNRLGAQRYKAALPRPAQDPSLEQTLREIERMPLQYQGDATQGLLLEQQLHRTIGQLASAVRLHQRNQNPAPTARGAQPRSTPQAL